MRPLAISNFAGLLCLLFLLAACSNQQRVDDLSSSASQSAPPAVAVNGHLLNIVDSVSILPYLGFLADEEGVITYDRIRQLDPSADFQHYGDYEPVISEKAAFWLTFELTNPSSRPLELVLMGGYEQDLHIYGIGEPKRAGTMIAAKDKVGAIGPGFFLRNQGFSSQILINLPPNQKHQIYLNGKRLFNAPLALEVKLIQPAFFVEQTEPGTRHFWEGLFQGMIWVLILYHLMLFATVKEVSYLYYCVYMVCISILTLGDFGYWQGYLLQNHPYLGWFSFQAFQYITGIMTLVFMQSFVQLDQLLPRWNKFVSRFILANVAILALVAIYYISTWDTRIVVLVKTLVVPFAFIGLGLCYLLIRSRDTVARYFAVAGIILAVSIAANAVYEQFVLGPNAIDTDYTRFYFIQASVIIHLLTFALGMGYRRREKDRQFQRTLELDKLKTRLYTNITHEFRTPLTVILGMSDQIKGHVQEKKLIKRNSQNLLRLINQLLDLSKLESGNLQLKMVQGDVVAYLQYLTESFYSMATDKQIRLTFYSEEDTLLMDYDESKLQHIVYNLLSNAIKYTEPGGKVIFHLVKKERNGQPILALKVKDNGIGISATALPHIFDRFYQVDGSATRKGEGTGIGLALTKELIVLLGGEIKALSQPEKGTEMIFWLPISNNALLEQTGLPISVPNIVEISNAAALEQPIPQPSVPDLPIVLIIEDNKDVVTYIQSILRPNYQVITATNGLLGIEQAIATIPDIIISDIMMPEKDGYEVCATLKQDQKTSHIPIVLLTAKASQEDRLKGLKVGADAFLTKPFDKAELLIRLQKLIDLRKQLQKRYADFDPLHTVDEKQLSHQVTSVEDAFLQKLHAALAEEISNPDFGVPQLAKAVHMSQMQVYRKLKALVGSTPSQFIRNARLQKSKVLLANSDYNISEIAYAVGFADPNYFSRTFHDAFGVSPTTFRG